MDLDPGVLVAVIGGLGTVVVSVLTTLAATYSTRQKDRVDMARLVNDQIKEHMERLEKEVKDQEAQIARLRAGFNSCRALTYRLLELLRRYDPTAASEADAAIRDLPDA